MPTPRRRHPLAPFVPIAGLAVALTIAVAGRANAAPPSLAPGSVVIRDGMGPSNVVTFVVPQGAAVGPREVTGAATAAGIPNDGVEEGPSDQPGVRELRLRTALSTRTSFLSRRIDAEVVRNLDVFGQGRVVLSLHPWARVDAGDVRPLESDREARRYAVVGESDLTYRVPASALLRALLLLLALALVPAALLRLYARRVSRLEIDAADKAHRLQASLMLAGLVVPLGLTALLFLGFTGLPAVLLGGLPPGLARLQVVQTGLTLFMVAAVILLILLPLGRAVAPSYRKLRGITATRRSRAGNLRMVLAMLLPLLAWIVLSNLLPATGLSPRIRVVVLAVGWIAIIVAMPSAAVRLMPTRPLDASLERRFETLVARAGVRVRGIRVLDTRGQKMANALIMGLLPRLRYVLVTDYLLKHLDQDEVEAIMAHEIGHAKQHHLLIKLGAGLGLAVALGAAVWFGSGLLRGAGSGVIVLAIPAVLVAGLVLIQGKLGLVLERKADDYAARQVGVGPTTRALEKIAELNLMKRRTGPLWNLMTQHPGIAERVERLQRARRPGAGATAASA